MAPSVITVTGPEAVTPPPAVEPFRGPATEGVTAAPATATDLSAPPGDLLAADILWDPAAVPVEGSVSDTDMVAAEPEAGPSDAAAAGGPGVAFEAAKGGGDGADGGQTEPALLADPDGTGESDGEVVEGDIGEGYALTSSWSSTGAASGDLDIITSGGAEYDEAKELNPGGWVAVNNDNDNYNFDTSDKAITTKQIFDLDDTGKVDRENDLVGILVKATTPHPTNPGKFTLEWTSSKIMLYRSADKDMPVQTGVVVAANDKFYVEGRAMTGVPADEKITLGWVDDKTKGRGVVDTVAFNVYEVRGAMNVPGYSNHTYSIRTPDARVSTIDTVIGGKADPTTVVNPTTFTTSRDILWDGGPILGKYKATPVVGEPFWSDREVNVVRVEFTTAAGPNNRLTLNNFPSQDPVNQARILSHATVAMTADLRVTTIDGPPVTAGGVMRGVKFIEMGFIQHVKAEKMNGVYRDLLVPQRLRHELQDGQYYLDTSIEPVSNRPWYNKSNDPRFGTRGYFRTTTDPVNAIVDTDFNITDTPRVEGTDPDQFDIVLDPLGEDRVDYFNIFMDFTLTFVAHTLDTTAISNPYTERAQVFWQFDGSGPVDKQGKWSMADGSSGNTSLIPRFRATVSGRTVAVPVALGNNAWVADWRAQNLDWVLEDL
ncbi:MAG: hypothetical protein K2X82_19115 [Gemmataceae bacterium]|nr:hypothetical protein [Gemmataceae bacterium]